MRRRPTRCIAAIDGETADRLDEVALGRGLATRSEAFAWILGGALGGTEIAPGDISCEPEQMGVQYRFTTVRGERLAVPLHINIGGAAYVRFKPQAARWRMDADETAERMIAERWAFA